MHLFKQAHDNLPRVNENLLICVHSRAGSGPGQSLKALQAGGLLDQPGPVRGLSGWPVKAFYEC